jgi:hypothetical protein
MNVVTKTPCFLMESSFGGAATLVITLNKPDFSLWPHALAELIALIAANNGAGNDKHK